jgi:hypothetical protein
VQKVISMDNSDEEEDEVDNNSVNNNETWNVFIIRFFELRKFVKGL